MRTLIGARAIDAAALHRQTGGNPFFGTEVLASTDGGLPPSIRDAVLARVARLSLSAQAVLQAAAVIGPRIEPWVLAEVSGTEVVATDECLAIGMLLGQGEALTFRHELARQTILEAISPPHKMVLQRLTLEALTASPATRHALARLAHHAEAASDRAAVLEYAPAAAKQAAAANAHRAAASLYALALRCATDRPADSRARLWEAYAQACQQIGQQIEGSAAQRPALELWRALGKPLQQGADLAGFMSRRIRAGQTAEVERGSQAAMAMLEALPPGRELALAYRVRRSPGSGSGALTSKPVPSPMVTRQHKSRRSPSLIGLVRSLPPPTCGSVCAPPACKASRAGRGSPRATTPSASRPARWISSPCWLKT